MSAEDIKAKDGKGVDYKEGLGARPPIIVCSGGRGAEVKGEIEGALARRDISGAEVSVVHPDCEINDSDFFDLGVLEAEFGSPFLEAWLRSTEEERPENLIRKSLYRNCLPLWGSAAVATAYRKMGRPVARHMIDESRKRARAMGLVSYSRDTVQVGFGLDKGEDKWGSDRDREARYFSHAGESIEERRKEAIDFSKEDAVAIITATGMVSGYYSIRDKMRMVSNLDQLFRFGDVEGVSLLDAVEYIGYKYKRQIVNFALVRVRKGGQVAIEQLEPDCFANVPGGLDFGKEKVLEQLEYLDIGARAVFDLMTFDEVYRSLSKWVQMGDWRSVLDQQGARGEIQKLRKGLLSDRLMDKQLLKTEDFYTQLPEYMEAVRRYSWYGEY